MKDIVLLARTWYISVNRHALDATPVARYHAEELLDIAVASSAQSLKETHTELTKLVQEATAKMADYNTTTKNFHRGNLYKGKIQAYEEIINMLVREVKLYEQRLSINSDNNGKTEEPYLTK